MNKSLGLTVGARDRRSFLNSIVPVVSIALLLALSAGSAVAQGHVPGRILVGFRANVSTAQSQAVVQSVQPRGSRKIQGIDVHVVELPANANENAVLQALRNRPEVQSVEFDQILQPTDVIPNDPYFANFEWHLNKIQAPAAWSTTTGSSSIIVAIIDTGIDPSHPDLASKLVAGWNTYDNTSNWGDYYGHGTKVAGTVAAVSNNGAGVASVCWNCLIMPVRAAANDGSATYSALASGLTWAADHGARVANISYIVTTSATVTSAAQYFQSRGGVVTSSAGNYSTFDSTADNPYIITVSATDPNDVLYSWSNTGNNVDVSAPGCVYTTSMGGGYSSACGTSFSAPIAAAVGALVLSVNPSLTPAQVTSILKQSADDIGAAGWDPTYGAGRVNAARAVSQAGGGTQTTTPTVTFQSPTNGSTVSGTTMVQVSATDSTGIASVSFYADSVLVGTNTVSPYTWTWNTTSMSNGGHTLQAIARNAGGNSATATSSVNVSNAVADTTPPSVSFQWPSGGVTLSGSVTVQASATDNVGVASVSFYVDGVLKGTDTASPYTFVLNTTTLSNGTHTLAVVAKDGAGNSATASTSVTVSNTADTIAPTAIIASPSSGSGVPTNLNVSVSASDNVGVTSVDLLVDGVLVGTGTGGAYTFRVMTNKWSSGAHTLQARARDAAGNVGLSAVVTVYR